MTTTELTVEEFSARYDEAWGSHDVDAILALHTEDTSFHLHLLGAPAVHGKDAVREAIVGLLTVWPDIRFDTQRLTATTDGYVTEYTLTATLAVPLSFGDLVAQPTGKPLTITGCDFFTLRDGKVASKRSYLDIASAQQQLGLLDR
ncbi:ester cyclase [Pseudonocardia spinosispora]|uniref:ester cyclase n=1 Tax=Pseudonocardia spinosispora TaxID=103441 RepID=UPI000409E386|nr:nuclear transport factor 2 family protein [Pseudonocardia spinosispora]